VGDRARPRLLEAARDTAPGITLRFTDEGQEGAHALRDGAVDLELGILRHAAPEIVVEELYREPFVAVAAPDTPYPGDFPGSDPARHRRERHQLGQGKAVPDHPGRRDRRGDAQAPS